MTAFEAPPPPRINALSGFLFSINGINDFSKPIQSVLNPIFLLSNFFIVLTAPIALATSSISSVTSGQFVSWYIDNELIGSGIIN